jgi:mercuric ion transport protein
MSADVSRDNRRKKGVAAAGSVTGAILASSCCIAPLLLVTLGVSGAWIGSLSALRAYQPLFVGITLLFLGFGFWQVYGRKACDAGSHCRTPLADRIVKLALWGATALLALAIGVDYWAPLFY